MAADSSPPEQDVSARRDGVQTSSSRDRATDQANNQAQTATSPPSWRLPRWKSARARDPVPAEPRQWPSRPGGRAGGLRSPTTPMRGYQGASASQSPPVPKGSPVSFRTLPASVVFAAGT